MMKFFMPLKPNARDREVYDLLESGAPISSLDILRREYGHWPPNGLDYQSTGRLDQRVYVNPVQEYPAVGSMNLLYAGFVANDQEGRIAWLNKQAVGEHRTLYLNNLIFSGPADITRKALALGLSAEMIRDASHSTMTLASAAKAVTAAGMLWSSARYVYGSLLFSPLVDPHSFPAAQSLAENLGHEHVHVLQGKDRQFPSRETAPKVRLGYNHFYNAARQNLTPSRKIMDGMDRFCSLGIVKYHSRDTEVQARLHTVMTDGYKRWGKLPETRTEFFAALIDSGIRAPGDVVGDVARVARVKPALRKFIGKSAAFRLASSIVHSPVAELNVTNAHYKKLGMTDYLWGTTLPYLYGHLLELYGDPAGRQKMGFASTSKPKMVARRYFKEHDMKYTR